MNFMDMSLMITKKEIHNKTTSTNTSSNTMTRSSSRNGYRASNTRAVSRAVTTSSETRSVTHSVSLQHFKEMDRKMTGRMSKWQFGALVKLCGLTLTQPEMDKMWLSLNVADDGMYSYNSLLKNFVNLKSTTAERKEIVTQSDNTKELIEEAKRVQRERREKRKAKQQEVAKPPQSRGPPSRTASAASFPPPPPSAPASIMSTKSVRTKELLVKVKENVINNWEGLKSVFKFIDRNGFANITMKEMLDIMDSMNFCLTSDEKKELCQRFDLQRNGRFHYLEFMKCYSQRPENSERAKSFVYSKHTHTLTKKTPSIIPEQ